MLRTKQETCWQQSRGWLQAVKDGAGRPSCWLRGEVQGQDEADVEDDSALAEMTIRVCVESGRTWLALVHPRLCTAPIHPALDPVRHARSPICTSFLNLVFA